MFQVGKVVVFNRFVAIFGKLNMAILVQKIVEKKLSKSNEVKAFVVGQLLEELLRPPLPTIR